MELIPFVPYHVARIELQQTQEKDAAYCTPERAAALVNDMAWSVIQGDEIWASGGILPVWEGRAIAWALLSHRIGPSRFRRIHTLVKRGLEEAHRRGYWRIETTVDPEFDNAARWVAALGFRYEGRMRKFGPDGRDHLLVARVREPARSIQ